MRGKGGGRYDGTYDIIMTQCVLIGRLSIIVRDQRFRDFQMKSNLVIMNLKISPEICLLLHFDLNTKCA